MRKWGPILAALILLGSVVFATGTVEEPDGDAEPSETIEDGYGNAVEVRPYERIVVASPGAVEALFLIGAEGKIAAIGTSRSGVWPYDKTELLPNVGSVARPNLEEIVSHDPDLVILSAMSVELGNDLSRRGYPVFIYGAGSIDDVFDLVGVLGRLSGSEVAAEQLINERRAELDRVKTEIADRPADIKGAFLYAANPVMGFTEDSLPGEILDLLGVENIAAGLSGERPIISSELLLAENPDILFISMSVTSVEDLVAAEPTILQTRAGREGNIGMIDSALILRPSPRIVDGIVTLHEQLSAVGTEGE